MKKLVTAAYILLWVAHSATVDYTDQANWTGDCTSGAMQSPINLTGATARTDVNLYYSGTMWDNISRDTSIAYFWHYNNQAGKSSTVRYRLTTAPSGATECQEAVYTAFQFHFHRTSEHTVDGTSYNAEMHIVHGINREYSNCSNMKGFLVIGVIFNEVSGAADNSFLSTIDITNIGSPGSADIGAHLSSWLSGGVFNYEGSLTTPGCSEVVQWVVCKNVQSMSTTQKTAFDSMGNSNGSGGFTVSNRDIQTNSNTLYSIDASYIHGEDSEEDESHVWIPVVFSIIAVLIIVLVVLLVIMCIKARQCCWQKKTKIAGKGFRVQSGDQSEVNRPT